MTEATRPKTYMGILTDKALEREGLFRLLKVYLKCKAEIGESESKAAIKKAYEMANAQHSHEFYHNLLAELSRSHIKFPGFKVQNTLTSYGYTTEIDFDEDAEFIMKEWPTIQSYCDNSYALISEKMENNKQNAMIHINLIHSILGRADKEKEDEELATEMPPLEDSCVFVMLIPKSLPGMCGFLIFTLQMAAFGITVIEMFSAHDGSQLPRSTYLGLPRGVDTVVHVTQGITMVLILLVQESLWEGLGHLFNGYNDTLADQGISRRWFEVSNWMRITEGLVATYVTFVLTVTADNVVDLFKDFMAMTFVSSFDNIIYQFAKMNVIGKTMKIAATQGEKVMYKINYEYLLTLRNHSFKVLRRHVIHPIFVFSILLVAMYVHWAYSVMLPQMNRQYLCQRLHIQLDDNVNETFSYFSGSYKLYTGSRRSTYPSYIEMRGSVQERSDRPPMVLRYCANLDRWAFMLEKKDVEEECILDTIYARSDVVADAEKYDIFKVSTDDWKVWFETDRLMPLEDLFIKCEDVAGIQHDLNKTIDGICKEMVTDEREGPFVSARTWATNYKLLSHENGSAVEVYDHPVFASPRQGISQDLLIFLGKRWVITSRSGLNDFDEKIWKLEDYLQKEFHGKWSDYEVGFFSQAVNVETPQDMMSPQNLKWYDATQKYKGENQAIEENKPIKNMFLCALCDNDVNPCFYEGVCSDEKCNCIRGSSGTLCQVLPSNNGLCNTFFNKLKYDFDGGDCCINTCVSSEKHKCGKDKSGVFHVGYDICEKETCVDCWRKSKPASSFSQLVVADISLSENGQILALIESAGLTVRVYDNDGINWLMRGAKVTDVNDATTDSVQISGPEFVLSNNVYSPITVAVLSANSVSVFAWDEIRWKKLNFAMPDQSFVTHMTLKSNGHKLGIIYKENKNSSSTNQFELFDLPVKSDTWLSTYEAIPKNENFTLMTLSGDGNKVALASNKCLELHDIGTNSISNNCTLFARDIMKIQISRTGKILAILVKYFGFDGDIHVGETSQNIFTPINEDLRGISTVGTTIDVSNDGLEVTAHSTSDEKLRFYEFKNSIWKKKQDDIVVKSMSLSTEHTVLAAIAPSRDNNAESLLVYNRNDLCDSGKKKVRFTFIPDSNPEELSYEIVNVTLLDDKIREVEILRKVGRYDKAGGMIVEDICIDDILTDHNKTKSCIGIRVYDFGLDGLESPGAIGVSIDGSIVFSTSISDGYEQIFPAVGNMECMGIKGDKETESKVNNTVSNIKYDVERHDRCAFAECKWRETLKLTLEEASVTFPLFSLSADGLVLAMGKFYAKNYAGEVVAYDYDYDSGSWIQRGQNIIGMVANGRFGRAVSLSADGSIIVVGAPNADIVSESEVSVYKYNQKNQTWIQYGSVLDESPKESTVTVGSSVDISSDGSIVAVGVLGEFKKEHCLAYIFRFNETTSNWDQIGNCIESPKGYHSTKVKLSSNGLIVAIGNPSHSSTYPELANSRGRVVVYEYTDDNKHWKLKGQRLDGLEDFGYWGMSIDISSDGAVLAISGILNRPAIVYAYNIEKKSWGQRGQGIIVSKVNSENFALSLSSSGTILVVTHDGTVSLYLYDSMSGIWSQGISQVPPFDFTRSDPLIVASADATTLVSEGKNDVHVFRLEEVSVSNCQKYYNFFNFTIQPDQFPKDISWSIQSQGLNILGSRLSENGDGKDNSQLLTFTKCVPPNQIYTFVIEDDYGDGICCSWGDGSFSLEWNNVKVMNSFNFTSSKHLCLPQTLNTNFFSVDFGLGVGEILDPSISWYLMDAKQNVLNKDKIPYQCIPNDECTYFVLHDKFGNNNGVSSSFTGAKVETDGIVVLDLKKPGFSFSRTSLGCEKQKCLEGSYLLEMQVLTDAKAKSFNWKLRDFYAINALATGNYEERFKYYYSYVCIPATLSDSCLELEINEPKKGRSDFQLSLNDTIILKANAWNRQQFNSYGNCKSCGDGETLFEIGYETDNGTAHNFSWELKGANGSIIKKGGYNGEKTAFVHNVTCITKNENECYTLRLFDPIGKGRRYKAQLGNVYMRDEEPVNFVEKHIIGKSCSFLSCTGMDSTFELDFRTDVNPDVFSWELVDLNNTILDNGGNYTNTSQPYYHKKCISVDQKQSVTLRLHFKTDNKTSDQQGVVYMASWNGVPIKKGMLSTDKHEIVMNRCPQNQTRFELGIRTDGYPKELSWELKTSNAVRLASRQNYNVSNKMQYYGECIAESENGNGCVSLILRDSNGDGGTAYSVRWDGKLIDEYVVNEEIVDLKRMEMAYEKVIDMRTPYEFNFTADDSLVDFSAQLFDSASNPLANMIGGFTEANKSHKTKQCIALQGGDDIILRMNNTNGIYYDVKSHGQILLSEKAKTASTEIKLFLPFEIKWKTDFYGEEFSWQLRTKDNHPLSQVFQGFEKHQSYKYTLFPQNYASFPQNHSCFKAILFDGFKDGGTSYSVKWAGSLVETGIAPKKSHYSILMPQC